VKEDLASNTILIQLEWMRKFGHEYKIVLKVQGAGSIQGEA